MKKSNLLFALIFISTAPAFANDFEIASTNEPGDADTQIAYYPQDIHSFNDGLKARERGQIVPPKQAGGMCRTYSYYGSGGWIMIPCENCGKKSSQRALSPTFCE